MLTKMLALFAAAVIVGPSSVETGHDASTTVSTRDWIASVLSYDGSACSASCVACPPPGWDHRAEFAPGAEFSGPTHECKDTHPGCDDPYHECGLAMTRNERDILIRLVISMPATELMAIDVEEPNFQINWKRKAIQILGCGGTVVASLGWTPDQRSEFDTLTGEATIEMQNN